MVVVSLVEEFVLGGGSELALASDFRLSTPNSTLEFVQTKFEIVPMWGVFTRLAHVKVSKKVDKGKQFKLYKSK